MAVFAGPEIVNDGLVFHFDLQNIAKSWKGKPTTNLISQSGIDFSEFTNYQTLSVERVVENESASGFALKMKLTETGINSASRSRFGNADNIPTSGEGFVSAKVKKTGTGNIIPRIYTGFSWYSLEPLEDDNPYLTTEYRRFGRYVTFGTNSGGPNPGFSMTQLWSNAEWNTDTTTYWHSPQVEVNTFATRYVNGVRLDTGSIIDISGSNYTIKANNLTYRQDDTPTFDGTDDYISVIDNEPNSLLKMGVGDFSIISWIKVYSGFFEDNYIFSKIGDGSYQFGIDLAGRMRLRLYTVELGYNQSVSSDFTMPVDQWSMISVVASRSNSSSFFYNDQHKGGEDITSHQAAELSSTNYPFIGYNPWIGTGQDQYFLGEIDQVKVYNRALTEKEVKQNFEATRSRYGI